MIYKDIELYYPEREKYDKEKIHDIMEYSEMTEFQRGFLCGLLKMKRPKKVLEIGASAGGTTTVILDCLEQLSVTSKVYSVDIAEKWYRSPQMPTGFIARKYINRVGGGIQHSFVLGKSIPYVIDTLGKGIDFLILDTAHAIPGELLDFLICLPYLENSCIVVLHDVVENHVTCRNYEIATKVLFDLVQGEKWCMDDYTSGILGFSNIAAFEVTESTRKNIFSVFSGLAMSWEYMLEDDELLKYYEIVKKYYSQEYAKWLDRVFKLQKYTQIRKEISIHYNLEHEWLKMKWEKEKNVFLYGGGYWAQKYSEYARINNLPINGWIISDEQDMVETGVYNLPVYFLSDLPYSPEECSIILALDHRHFPIIRKKLASKGYFRIL